MELFLNLFWLSLLVPAFLLWRQRTSSDVSHRHVALICVLGCILLLLFPVISATDDLHPMRPEMKESERSFRHASNNTRTLHVPARSSYPLLPLGTLRPRSSLRTSDAGMGSGVNPVFSRQTLRILPFTRIGR
jgi:hypothetical protein